MSTADCLARLEALLAADVRDERPPWASETIAFMPQCGEAAVPWLRQRAMSGSAESFLALEALRVHAPHAWAAMAAEERAAIYATQLADAHWFNAWGFPSRPSDTARAVIDLGKAAIPSLRPLLGSRRPAPSYGSEEASMSRLGGYRVRDYAWTLLAELTGASIDWSENAEERDRQIDAFARSL